MQESDEDGVLLEIPPVKGRGKATERRLAYAEIAKARVQVEFNRKGLDEDADDLADDVADDLAEDADDADLADEDIVDDEA